MKKKQFQRHIKLTIQLITFSQA